VDVQRQLEPSLLVNAPRVGLIAGKIDFVTLVVSVGALFATRLVDRRMHSGDLKQTRKAR
jgi:hypothetical protein